MPFKFIKNVILNENVPTKDLELLPLPYGKDDLDPVFSSEAIFYHHNKLAKTYVDRYNSGEGDADFNEAGAFLHNMYFPQFQAHSASNEPNGPALEFIIKHFKSFDNFKKQFRESAMGIQGSGWVYLARNGEIKTIVNHETRQDIVLLVDWWEHAWALDYKWDKKKYLENTWSIINWNVIGARIGLVS